MGTVWKDYFDVTEIIDSYENRPAAAAALGVDRRTINRWLKDGVNWETADKIAMAAGFHPMEVWGDRWLVAS